MKELLAALWVYLFASSPETPGPEPMPDRPENFIDYRTCCRWGHNIMMLSKIEGREGFYAGMIVYPKRVKRGGLVLWPTNYGYAVGLVHEVETRPDPGDLHRVTLEVIARVTDPPKTPRTHIHNHGGRL